MEITKKELHIMRHALGLDYQKVAFRNNFVTGIGTSDYPICEVLVAKELMVKRNNPFDEVGESFVYHVTDKGRIVALKKKEKNKNENNI